LSVGRVEGYRTFGTKLWDAARFAQVTGCVPDPDVDPAGVGERVNQWIVGETARLCETAQAALEGYRFNDYAGALYAHVWGVYCDWYLELSKPLLQGEDAGATRETQATAAWALDQILKLMHPVSPFITEELWSVTGGAAGRPGPLALEAWPRLSAAALATPEADAEMGWVVQLIETVRSVKAELNAPPSAQAPLTLVGAGPELAARVARNRALIDRLARLSALDFADAPPKGAVTAPIEGATLALALADVIDVSAEKTRLEKALAKLGKEAEGLEKKLSNDAFLAKAPEDVVAEQRERLAAAQADAQKLQAAVARLKELEEA
ncbi:MAG: class I tRNA ligase family protein, partial [Pseudomonadota bacterium]